MNKLLLLAAVVVAVAACAAMTPTQQRALTGTAAGAGVGAIAGAIGGNAGLGAAAGAGRPARRASRRSVAASPGQSLSAGLRGRTTESLNDWPRDGSVPLVYRRTDASRTCAGGGLACTQLCNWMSRPIGSPSVSDVFECRPESHRLLMPRSRPWASMT
jgi:hypothetical protein